MSRETHSDDHDLRIELHQGDYPLSRAQRARMEKEAEALWRLIAVFPRTDLKVEIGQGRGGVRVSAALWLGGRTLFAGAQADTLHPAWENCLKSLMRDVTAYKQRMSNKPTYDKQRQGTRPHIEPTMDPDAQVLHAAVEELDYGPFRRAMSVYEDAVEQCAARWIGRFPKGAGMLGTQFDLADIVEGVFLNAFERYLQRPQVPLGDWLEELVVRTIRGMIARPDEERENARFAATAWQAHR